MKALIPSFSLGLPVLAVVGSLALISATSVLGGSATWNLNPASSDWNTATNWMPNTVPNGAADTATFASSNTTSVSLSANTTVSTIIFNPGASAFTITANPARILTISGAGIINSSGTVENFVMAPLSGGGGVINFFNSAGAGSQTSFTNSGALEFFNSSSAGSGTFTTLGGGTTRFINTSTAASGMFFANGSTFNGGFGGAVFFTSDSTAGSGTFTTTSGAVSGGFGAQIIFADSATAADGTFNTNGGAFSGANAAALTVFQADSTAGNSTLIANSGTGVGGGVWFSDDSLGDTARLEVFGNGNLDISLRNAPGVTIGSLEGTGVVKLGARNLGVGSRGLSTSFSGVIQDGGVGGGTGGSLTKIGSGVFILSGAATYSGVTTVEAGTLVVANLTGSATGAGAVQVNAGTLGGGGMVSGAVTVGTGNGVGAFLAPAAGTNKQGTFTTLSALTLYANATYSYTAKARARRFDTDKVVANGVTIDGATFSFRARFQGALRTGTVFTVISNTSAAPIAGTFSNLAEGAILTASGDTFQANYEGGDGNDLTLTVL